MLTKQGFVETKPAKAKKRSVQLRPHDEGSEIGVIGGCLVNPDMMVEISDLDPSHFFIANYGLLFGVLKDLYDQHQTFDLLTVSNEMEKRDLIKDFGGVGALVDLMNDTPLSIHVPLYARSIIDDWGRRQTIAANEAIVQMAYDRAVEPVDLLNFAAGEIAAIDLAGSDNGPKSSSDCVSDFFDEINYIAEHGARLGLPTGIKRVDKILGGLNKENFIVIAGRPGMGKSVLAQQIATDCGGRVLFFSLEMGATSLTRRRVSRLSGVPYSKMKAPLTDQEHGAVYQAGLKADGDTVKYVVGSTDVAGIERAATKEKAINGLDLIVVDHLGLIKSETRGDKTYETTEVSHGLLNLSKKLNIPVVALSQLSRKCEDRHDKRPELSDLRNSGEIEQDADVVMFIYRDEYYNPDTEFPNIAEIGIAKNRDGQTGIVSVYAKMATAEFVDLEVRTEPLDY